MRKHIMLTLAGVALVSAVTLIAVKARSSQDPPPKTSGGSSVVTHKVTRRGNGIPPAPRPLRLLDGMTTIAKFRSMDVQAGGGAVWVTGQVEVAAREHDRRYVWLLRVYSANGTKPLVDEHHYIAESNFLPPDQNQAVWNFDDTIQLNRGSYRIELMSYDVPRTFDFGTLKYGQDMTGFSSLNRIKRVTVD
jgi:hypothetical protein